MITTLIREYPSSNFQNFLRLRRQGGPVDPPNQNLADALAHGQCDARPTVTFPAVGHHRPLTGTKLYCSVTEARLCEQLAQGCYVKARGRGSNPRPSGSQVQPVNPAVDCRYFLPGLQLALQPLRGLLPVLLLGEQRHSGCEQFA